LGEYAFFSDVCTFPDFKDITFAAAARRSMDISNAGGSSELSEALSMQYMHMMFGLNDFIPEMEVAYYIDYKMCDYLIRLDAPVDGAGSSQDERTEKEDQPLSNNVGVSVTRAVSYPFGTPYTMEKARELLNRKLYGLVVARECVAEANPFQRAILHVWCYSSETAEMIRAAHGEMVAEDSALPSEQRTYDSVAVICSVCSQTFIYNNRKL
jgi:hypothetical protein